MWNSLAQPATACHKSEVGTARGQNLGIWGVFHCSTLLRLTLYIVSVLSEH